MKKAVNRPRRTKPAPDKVLRHSSDTFLGVGMGASAGGLEAVTQLLKGLPDDTGMAFVLVQHLDQPATRRRRISRRLVLQKLETLNEYAALLRSHPAEVEALFKDILICVTGFFRDAKMFDLSRKKLFPKLLTNRQPDAPIRLWSAGCSTGEEAHSRVIALVEFLEKEGVRCPIQLSGTGINESVLNCARTGLYPDRIKDNVSPERLRRFFTKADHGCRTNKNIRDYCMFARQNVREDPPCSHVDLLTCRNVLIYFDAALQKKVIRTSAFQREETEGKFIHGLGAGGWAEPRVRELLEKVLPMKSSFQDFRIEISLPGLKKKTTFWNARRFASRAGQPPMILLAMEEVTGKPNPP